LVGKFFKKFVAKNLSHKSKIKMSYLVEKNLLYKIGTSAQGKSKTSVRKNSPRKTPPRKPLFYSY